MKTRPKCLGPLLLMLALVPLFGQPVTIDASKLDRIVLDAMDAWKVPGAAVAMIQNDRVLLAKGYGVKKVGSNDPVTAKTLFAIGSATKAFTTCAAAMLIDDGKMAWDDPVRKHVEFFRLADPLADELVTLRDLMCHRTGLSRNDMLWIGSPWGREELIRRIGFVPLTRPFRSAYQYQNLMFLTAGYAVGRASGGTWEDFVQKRIFDPLGMTGADFSTSVAEKAADHATPHGLGKDRRPEVIPWRNIDNIAPAGAINASVDDLTKWMRMQLNDGMFEGKRLVSEKNLHETHTPQMAMRPEDAARSYNPDTHLMAYGLGWRIQDYHGLEIIEHGGAIDGFRANFTFIPERKLAVVVLSNLGQENMPEALRWSIIDAQLGFAPRDWNALLIERGRKEQEEVDQARKSFEAKRQLNTRPSRDLSAYAGDYQNAGYGTVTIGARTDALTAVWLNHKQPLEHFHFDTFLWKGGRLNGDPVQFILNPAGEVVALTMLEMNFVKDKTR